MPEITLEIPADIAERVSYGTPEIYLRLVQIGLKRRMKEHERSYHRADAEFEGLVFGATEYDAILGVTA